MKIYRFPYKNPNKLIKKKSIFQYYRNRSIFKQSQQIILLFRLKKNLDFGLIDEIIDF